jgi:phosphodiesterase/alkaline phosphatase D-like protein
MLIVRRLILATLFCLLLVVGGQTTPDGDSSQAFATLQLIRYPYVQSTTSNSTVIAWATDIAGTSEVHYSTDQSYSQMVAATSTLVNSQYYHAATLTGLSVHTTYYYKVFTGGTDLTPWSAVTFTTATTGDSFTFVAYGDSRDGSQAAQDLSAQMQLWSFDLALHTGDIATSGQYNQFQDQYFAIYRDMIRSIPFFTSLGNHDYGVNPPQPYLDVFYLPENAPAGDKEEYY